MTTAAAEFAIETEQLRKQFGSIVAVNNLDLHVANGSVIGLLGPNGCGKTTVIRMLATLLRPTAGWARVAGHDTRRDPHLIRRSIGLTGQYAAVDDFLTGRENLRLIGRLLGLSAPSARARAVQLLTEFDLLDAADRQLRTYSGGMRRRLDLAVSLVGRPVVVFLDEPTTGLDPRSRQSLWQVIESLRTGGTTVLLSSQYLEEVDRLADRVVILDVGSIVAEGTPDELRSRVGGACINVTLSDLSTAPAAARVLEQLATGTVGLDEMSRQLRVPVDKKHGVADVVRLLDASSIAFSHLDAHEPSLDDVFLAVTGRAATDPMRNDEDRLPHVREHPAPTNARPERKAS